MKKLKIAIVVGTRPEIIKMSPIIRACKKDKINFFIIHSGQHYSYNLDKIFFKELKLPKPKYKLNVGSGHQGKQTSKILEKVEEVLIREKPSVALVQGDTNTVLASALASVKLHIPVGHVEAGLRSYDSSMPEEINRTLTDHMSTLLFAPTKKQEEILRKEGITKKVFVTGNTVVDAVFQNIKIAKEKSRILSKLKVKRGEYVLITVHRAENTDNKTRFKNILKGINVLIKKHPKLKFIYPIHPRSKDRIKRFKLNPPKNLIITEPLGYLDFLILESNARIILTDSGGLQEEACILRVPCVTLRYNTERPETVEVGANTLAGTEPKKILSSFKKMLNKKRIWKNPFGDGKASQKIIRILRKELLDKAY